MKTANAVQTQAPCPIDLLDEIDFSVSQNQAVSRMLQAVFEIAAAHKSGGTPSETEALFEGLAVVIERLNEDLETINQKVSQLYKVGAK